MEGAKNRIFGAFEAFFDLCAPQKRRKHDTSVDFAAFLQQHRFLSFASPFVSPFVSKFCANGAAKTPQNLTKCRVCGAFAARISGKK